jgi:hypothetical protein
MASTARLTGALLLAIASPIHAACLQWTWVTPETQVCVLDDDVGRTMVFIPSLSAKCDHACWRKICSDMTRQHGTSFVACMRDQDRP